MLVPPVDWNETWQRMWFFAFFSVSLLGSSLSGCLACLTATIGFSNHATLHLALTGAALMKLKYFFGTDLGRRSRLQVIVPFQPPSPR